MTFDGFCPCGQDTMWTASSGSPIGERTFETGRGSWPAYSVDGGVVRGVSSQFLTGNMSVVGSVEYSARGRGLLRAVPHV